jgi:hypothetical protein
MIDYEAKFVWCPYNPDKMETVTYFLNYKTIRYNFYPMLDVEL